MDQRGSRAARVAVRARQGRARAGWAGSLGLGLGIAAGAAAAQFGIGYGLGIIEWPTQAGRDADNAWLAALAWAGWIAATSTVLAAMIADRLSTSGAPRVREEPIHYGEWEPATRTPVLRVPGVVATSAWRTGLALAAALGATVAILLVAVPARAAHRPETSSPQVVAAGYAVVGILVGLVIALGALSSRAVAANVTATTCWLWALAILAVVDDVQHGRPESAVPLASWHFGSAHLLRGTLSLPAASLMMGAAVLIGALAAIPGAWRGDNRVGTALSGATGPLLVAAAYFLAAPTLAGTPVNDQLSAYLIAPYAVIAGLAGSVLVTAMALKRDRDRLDEAGSDERTGDGDADDQTTVGMTGLVPEQPQRGGRLARIWHRG